MIELKNVSVTYDTGTVFQRPAIRNVSLKIEKGERIAIVGRVGSGKSTLIQLFNGLIKPDEGEVLLNGKNIHDRNSDLKKVRKSVGLVFQYPEEQFFAETVFEEVSFGPKNFGFSGEKLKEAVYNALTEMGFQPEEVISRSPFGLSGGEKRRVAIASVIASDPDVIILDEPTSGLDFIAKKRLVEYLKNENKSGRTLIFVTHDMSEVLNVADRVIAIRNGEKMFDGSVENFFSLPHLIESVGLEPPFIVKLMFRLKEKYAEFPFCRNADELILHLKERWRGSAS